MLSKEERKKMNEEFWGGFKQYMRKKMSSNGRRINWINYPSDVKEIFIRWEVTGKTVRLCCDIQPKDEGVRKIIWEQLGELKAVLVAEMLEEGVWQEDLWTPDGRMISRISWENAEYNYFNKDEHEDIYRFMERTIRAFDRFYQEYKEILISLVE